MNNANTPEFRSTDIIPSLKKVITTGGNILLEKQLALTFHEDFANEEKLLKEKFSGVAEQQAFDRDLALFYEKISVKEMPCWSRMGVNFRLPHPGLTIRDGLLYANTSIEGAQIRYTTDGTEPTVESELWETPVACQAAVVKAKLFYRDKQSVTSCY